MRQLKIVTLSALVAALLLTSSRPAAALDEAAAGNMYCTGTREMVGYIGWYRYTYTDTFEIIIPGSDTWRLASDPAVIAYYCTSTDGPVGPVY
jgi:hypothetical protein